VIEWELASWLRVPEAEIPTSSGGRKKSPRNETFRNPKIWPVPQDRPAEYVGDYTEMAEE